jgi:hypothetical protein
VARRRQLTQPAVERPRLSLRANQRAELRAIGTTAGTATIDCGGARHRLSVRDGELHTHDHDAVGELALHALGGRLADCLIYVLVWRQSFADGFLSFWAAHESLDALARAHLRRQWIDNYWEGWPSEPPPAVVLFEQQWQDALGAAVARHAVRAGRPDRVAAVHRAVRVRLRTAFVKSLASVSAHRRPDALVPLTIAVEPGPPAASGRLAQSGSSVELRVGAEWLWEVWAAGGAVVDGRLVLAHRLDRVDGVAYLDWQPTGAPDGEHLPNLRQ